MFYKPFILTFMLTKMFDATKFSPGITYDDQGILTICGRCIIEDPDKFFSPLFQWIQKYNKNRLTLEIRIEYLNTGSTKQILTLLKMMKANPHITDKYVKWYYEPDDEDMEDLGKDYESIVHIPFGFYELNEEAV